MNRYHKLTPQEEAVIEDKGTETPFSGEYETLEASGVYLCKRCDLPLYGSWHKFHTGCGWPSFDRSFEDAIAAQLDEDQIREEILCGRCGAHLGHRFLGEGLTERNLRHCVNSISLRFVPAFTEEGYERAILAGGCFWGVQEKIEELNNILSTRVGYTGGYVVDPTYEEVCHEDTGHREAVEVIFDPRKLHFNELLDTLFKNSCQTGKKQYSPAVYYLTPHQKECAIEYDIAVEPATMFYVAEEYHQHYNRKLRTGD